MASGRTATPQSSSRQSSSLSSSLMRQVYVSMHHILIINVLMCANGSLALRKHRVVCYFFVTKETKVLFVFWNVILISVPHHKYNELWTCCIKIVTENLNLKKCNNSIFPADNFQRSEGTFFKHMVCYLEIHSGLQSLWAPHVNVTLVKMLRALF